VCNCGSQRFLRIFRGEHDFGAFFAFVSLAYRVCAPATQGEHCLHVKRGPNRALKPFSPSAPAKSVRSCATARSRRHGS
jgi:hypothetical protein